MTQNCPWSQPVTHKCCCYCVSVPKNLTSVWRWHQDGRWSASLNKQHGRMTLSQWKVSSECLDRCPNRPLQTKTDSGLMESLTQTHIRSTSWYVNGCGFSPSSLIQSGQCPRGKFALYDGRLSGWQVLRCWNAFSNRLLQQHLLLRRQWLLGVVDGSLGHVVVSRVKIFLEQEQTDQSKAVPMVVEFCVSCIHSSAKWELVQVIQASVVTFVWLLLRAIYLIYICLLIIEAAPPPSPIFLCNPRLKSVPSDIFWGKNKSH